MRSWIAALIVVMAIVSPVQAVILYESPNRLAKPPAGSLAGSGWQWQGKWEGFLGTVISKNTFITAGHVGGNVGDYFNLNGVNYKTVATFNDPQSDLQIWSIHGRFTSAAPLFTSANETGKGVVIFGRGTQRGDPVVVNNQLKGWLWGANDGLQSWGKNIITGFAPSQSDASAGSKTVKNALVGWTFDANAWAHEGTVSGGDSGGGVFTKVGTTWELMGVNFGAESDFTLPGESIVKHGAIFDAGGLVFDGKTVADTLADIPTHGFATRISTRMSWINSVLSGKIAPSVNATQSLSIQGVPEPISTTPLFGIVVFLRRRDRKPARPGWIARSESHSVFSGAGVVIC
ncbi:MAG TPA: hypothetical protein VHD56_15610 [Tepidisphaeraceae bacterium]|nr:hypothetical protein [Tepidisphaeraceae bacterium]